jgi:hypothetical protein
MSPQNRWSGTHYNVTRAHEIVLSSLARPITDTMIRDEEVDPRLFGDPLARGRRNR